MITQNYKVPYNKEIYSYTFLVFALDRFKCVRISINIIIIFANMVTFYL